MNDQLLADAFLARMMDHLPGAVTYLTAIHDAHQRLIDFQFVYGNVQSEGLAGPHYQPVPGARLRNQSLPETAFTQTLFDHYAHTFLTGQARAISVFVPAANRPLYIWCSKIDNGVLSAIGEQPPPTVNPPKAGEPTSAVTPITDELRAIDDDRQAGVSLYRLVRNGEGQIDDFALMLTSQTNQTVITHFSPFAGNDLIGQRITSFFPDIKRLGLFDRLVEVAQTGQPQRYEWHPHWKEQDLYFEVIITAWSEGIALSMVDITNHKRLQDTLREEHRRLAQAQAMAHIGSFVRYLTSDKTEWSDELYRIHGLAPQSEAITTETLNAFVHPEDRAVVHSQIQSALEHKARLELTYRIIRRDGTVRVLKNRCELLTNALGTIDRMYGTSQDITEPVAVEEELKQQAHFIRQIFDTVPGTISVYDIAQKGIVYINRRQFARLGYNEQELDELADLRWIETILHPDDQAKMRQHIGEMASAPDDRIRSLDYRIQNRAGDWEWRRTRAKVFLRDDRNQPLQYISIAQDITHEKRSEGEIQKNKELLEAVLHTVPVSIVVFEAIRDAHNTIVDFRCTLSNGVADQRLRINIVGQTLSAFLPDYANHENFRCMVQTIETGEPTQHTTRYVFGRDTLWLDGQYNKLGDSVVVCFDEITQLKEAEEQLKGTAARLQSTFNGVPASVTLMEVVREPKSGRIIDFTTTAFNQKALELTGCSAEELQTKTMLEVNPDAKTLGLFDDFIQVYQSGHPAYRELTLTRNGQAHCYAFYVTPQIDGHGVVVTALNVSNLKKAEHQTRQTAEGLQAVMDTSPAAIGMLKAVRNENRTKANPKGELIDFYVVAGNEKFAQQFYRPLHLVTQRRVSELLNAILLRKLFTAWEKVLTTGKPVYQERQVTSNGFKRWVGESIIREDDGLILTALDITDLKVAKDQEKYWFQQLQQYGETAEALDQLRQVLQQRNELLRATSHDLRGSFGVIQGAATLMTMMDTEEDRNQMLTMMQRNLRQATQLLTQLLDFSRLEAGLEELKVEQFDAAGLLQQLSDSVQPMAEEKALTVQTRGPAQLMVEGDVVKVHRIAQNLILNALKYTESGSVTVGWTTLDSAAEWCFTVADTGPGLPPGLVTLLRNGGADLNAGAVDATRSPSGKGGEGIGLAIVRRLTMLLNARLEVESEPDQGTLFRIILPVRYEGLS